MKVLLVKMSSFGDVLHTLPALEDLYRAKGIQVDWAVEPSFSQIANLSKAVRCTIDVPLRAMRKQAFTAIKTGQLSRTLKALRAQQYDMVLDAQGLIKSACISLVAHGKRYGFNKNSIREPLASRFYHTSFEVSRTLHAVARTRELFAQTFGYDYHGMPLDYGIDVTQLPKVEVPQNALLFLHGTTWETKHWPEHFWHQLTHKAATAGYKVLLPWGNASEHQRALRIAEQSDNSVVLPKMSLMELAGLMLNVKAAVAVDTGLGHLCAALDVPCFSIYGPTDPMRTGTYGNYQTHLASTKSCAPCLKRSCQLKGTFVTKPPCFESVDAQRVWLSLQGVLQPNIKVATI